MTQNEDNKKIKIEIIMYIISIILFILTFIPCVQNYKIIFYIIVIILSGYKLIYSGIKNIFKFNFEEDTLMTIAIIAAFILGEYPESCMVVLLFKLGEFLEEKAVEKSNKSIENIVEIKSKTANRLLKENIEVVDVEEIKVSDTILIKPGEIVPLDCIILEGTSYLDTSSLTGESKLKQVGKEDKILSGMINIKGSLKCKVTKDYKNSTSSQIVDLVYQATTNKGKTENLITKFSKIYTPIVILSAIILVILPTLFFDQDLKIWIMRALVFLVASCPCSIVISIPLAFFACIGKISKKGMLIKGTKHIENLSKAKIIAFDKTGTITTGKMEIDEIGTFGDFDENENLIYMYNLEKNSNHPISTAIVEKVERECLKSTKSVIEYEEIAGCGILANIEGKKVIFGNKKMLQNYNIDMTNIGKREGASYLVIDGKIAGYITLKEEIRDNIDSTIEVLKKNNIKRIIMLTGDNNKNAYNVAEKVNIKEIYSELLPQEKQEKINEFKKQGSTIFVGDGINDSPVLAEADFGISMGEGTEIASNAADGILISNNISTIPEILSIAKKTIKIIKINIIFSLIIKAVVLYLAVLGIAPMWLAIIADTGVSLLTIINSIRLLK